MRTFSDFAHAQQGEMKTRSGHVTARAARKCAQLRMHDRREVGGEAPRPIERERQLPDGCAKARSEIAVRIVLSNSNSNSIDPPKAAHTKRSRSRSRTHDRPQGQGSGAYNSSHAGELVS